MKKILFISALLLMCVNLSAQSARPDSLVFFYPHDFIVTAARIGMPVNEVPFSISIVSKNTISKIPRSVAVDEPLKLVPGVKVDNQANGTRIHMSIRGQGILTERGIRGIKVLMDELPLNDPTGFAPDFFDVDFNNVRNIEILRGPAASLYGGSASGGIINITTQNLTANPLNGQIYVIGGSNDFWKGAGQFGGSSKNLNYSVSLSRMLGSGYRDHTHFQGNNFYGKAVYNPTAGFSITPVFCWTSSYHENPEGINLNQYNENPKQANPDAVPFNEFLETKRLTGGFSGMALLNETNRLQFNAYVRNTRFTEANNHTFNHRDILSPGGSLQYLLSYGKKQDFLQNTFSIGTDLQFQRIDEYRTVNTFSREGSRRVSDERIDQGGIGVFLIDKVKFGSKTGFMLSLRYDKIDNKLDDLQKTQYDLSGNSDFSKITGRIGLTYELAPEANLFANWGQGFLPPATEELAQNPDNFGGFNSHLTYASSNGFDLGLRGLYSNFIQYDVTLFYMTTENDFDRYRLSDNPLRNQETFYRNAGSSRRNGLELFTAISPFRNAQLQMAYTYSDFKYTNKTPVSILMDDPTVIKYIKDGNYLPNSPAHQLYVEMDYSLSNDLNVMLSYEALSKSYIDGANLEAEAASGYSLLHARIAYKLNLPALNGEISFSVKNITDRKYVAFTEPDPGGNAYQPGSGREFFAGIKIGF